MCPFTRITRLPKQRLLGLVLLALLLGAAGGGAPRRADADSTSSPLIRSFDAISSPQLNDCNGLASHCTTADPTAALLTLADLPPSWQAVDAAASPPSSYAWCPAGTELPVRPVARAARTFWSGTVGPVLYDEVLAFAPGEAAQALASIRTSPAECGWDLTDPDAMPMTFQLGGMRELGLGDEALRRQLRAETDGMVATADIVFICRGDFVVILTHLVMSPAPVEVVPDTALTEEVSTRAAAKLADLVLP